MRKNVLCYGIMGLIFGLSCLFGASRLSAQTFLSDDWRMEWKNPPAKDRPLQIVHGYASAERLNFLKDACHVGGVVCNFENSGYLQSEAGWEKFLSLVSEAKKLGLRVWVYDEDGYPSPAAGGLVIQGHPEFEAQELVYDSANAENPFAVRECYEFTHAANNFFALRRYPNVMSDAAMERFLDVTHRQYAKRLRDAGLFDVVEAFFTDEPSTNAFNTGEITKKVKVRVQDEPNPEKKNLPMVPWSADFPKVYQEMYGEDLLAVRKSLFEGDSPEDRKVRRQFWNIVGIRYENAFMGKVGKWCAENGKFSSGHALHEEALVYHVPCYGRYFTGTRTMQLAGMDFLNNQAGAALYGWRTAVYPASSNIMNGQRLMMTEISDHHERLNLERPATLDEMQLAAAWEFAQGCTEFTLYYPSGPETAEKNRAYCDFVGRMNAVLRDASVVKRAVLYYPCRDLQEEYRPTAQRLTTESQSERMQAVIGSYYARGQALADRQIPFMAADEEMLQNAEIVKDETGKAFLKLGNQSRLEILSIPGRVNLPENLVKLAADFRAVGGLVIDGEHMNLQEQLPRILRGNSEKVSLGEFKRENAEIYVISNAQTDAAFSGELTTASTAKTCIILNPATAEETSCEVQNGVIPVQLEEMKTLIYIVR